MAIVTTPANTVGENEVLLGGLLQPPKFNMEPENKSLEKESPFENHYFQVPC